ncbi:hypothetical protein AHF37_10421 [Paragonimus kellicotti]|nr:hypothetical protein AHF37_10421 [Paragonimus kellicotti]
MSGRVIAMFKQRSTEPAHYSLGMVMNCIKTTTFYRRYSSFEITEMLPASPVFLLVTFMVATLTPCQIECAPIKLSRKLAQAISSLFDNDDDNDSDEEGKNDGEFVIFLSKCCEVFCSLMT